MRKAISLLLLTVVLFAAPVPRKAAEFAIHMPDGKQLLLSSYRGKTVVLALMHTTCPHCQKTAPLLSDIQKEYANKGVQVLGATFDADAPRNIANFDLMFAKGFPCGYSSSDAVLTFLQQPATKPPFVPIMVFIDKTGMIRSVKMVTEDSKDDAPEQLFFQKPEINIRAELDKMLKGEPARRLPTAD
jgi:thiol-disulfide isomerase/thioredoxin